MSNKHFSWFHAEEKKFLEEMASYVKKLESQNTTMETKIDVSDHFPPAKDIELFNSSAVAKPLLAFHKAISDLNIEFMKPARSEDQQTKVRLCKEITEMTITACQNALGLEDKILVVTVVPKKIKIEFEGKIVNESDITFEITDTNTDLSDAFMINMLQRFLDSRSSSMAHDMISKLNREKAEKLMRESITDKEQDTTI